MPLTPSEASRFMRRIQALEEQERRRRETIDADFAALRADVTGLAAGPARAGIVRGSNDGKVPTWGAAVLAALRAGPPEGMHVSDIWTAVLAMGRTTGGLATSKDPLLMVDDALYRLRRKGKVERAGVRIWKATSGFLDGGDPGARTW